MQKTKTKTMLQKSSVDQNSKCFKPQALEPTEWRVAFHGRNHTKATEIYVNKKYKFQLICRSNLIFRLKTPKKKRKIFVKYIAKIKSIP